MSLVCACQVLADIEVAQSLQAQKVKEEEEEEVIHPLDQDYALLCCQLSLLEPASREYQVPLVPHDWEQPCLACRHPKGPPCPTGTVGIAGMAACGDTSFLPPSLAADPKLCVTDWTQTPCPQHLAGGPRG